MLASIGALFALEHPDRILGLVAGGVVPALDRRATELHPLTGVGVTPLLGSQLTELDLDFAPAGRRGEQRSHVVMQPR